MRMYSEVSYFDPIGGPLFDDSSPQGLETDPMDDLYNSSMPDVSSENGAFYTGTQLDHLHDHLGIDIEPDPKFHTNWQPTTIMEDMQECEFPMMSSMQCYVNGDNSAAYPDATYISAAAPPDLLNLLHLPSGTVPPAFPSVMPYGVPGEAGQGGTSPVLYDSGGALHLGCAPSPPQSQMLRDFFHALPQSYGLFCGAEEKDTTAASVPMMAGGGGLLFQDMDDVRQLDGVEFRSERGEVNTERQRRQQFNEKYNALRSLVPNPTKADRASIVGDAIDYIKELRRTIMELKILVENKRLGQDRRSSVTKLEDESGAGDVENSMIRPLKDINSDQGLSGALRSSWLQRRSKDSFVDVRVIEDEVNIKVTLKRKTNCLLPVAKVLDELHLDLSHVAGGFIGSHYVFLLNAKICEGSTVYAGAIVQKSLKSSEDFEQLQQALPRSTTFNSWAKKKKKERKLSCSLLRYCYQLIIPK